MFILYFKLKNHIPYNTAKFLVHTDTLTTINEESIPANYHSLSRSALKNNNKITLGIIYNISDFATFHTHQNFQETNLPSNLQCSSNQFLSLV